MKKYPKLSQLDLVTLNTYKAWYIVIFKGIIQLLPFEVINFIPWSIFLLVKFCFHRGITSVHAYNSLEVFYFHNSRACALCRSRISNLLSEIRWKFFNFFPPKLQAWFLIWLLFDGGSRSSGSVAKRHTFLFSVHQGQTNF